MPSIYPHLSINGAAKAIEYYQKAFGAVVIANKGSTMPGDERVMHAEISIQGCSIYLADTFPEFPNSAENADPLTYKGSPVSITINLDKDTDVDSIFNQAVSSGGKAGMPPGDAFWGDRYATLSDPFGHRWALRAPLPADRAAAAQGALEDGLKAHTGEGQEAKRQKIEEPIELGLHGLVYSTEAVELRKFFKDTLGFNKYVDAGEGWLIFQELRAELGAHPAGETEKAGTHELSLSTTNLEKTLAALQNKGVKVVQEAKDQGWGIVSRIQLPGAGEMMLYQPKY